MRVSHKEQSEGGLEGEFSTYSLQRPEPQLSQIQLERKTFRSKKGASRTRAFAESLSAVVAKIQEVVQLSHSAMRLSCAYSTREGKVANRVSITLR